MVIRRLDRGDRRDIMVEQGNKELLPAIVLPFCSGLGSVSLGFLWHTDHTHKHTLAAVKPNLRTNPKMSSLQ